MPNKTFLDTLEGLFLYNIVNTPTSGSNILYLIFTSSDDLISDVDIIENNDMSDHYLITGKLSYHIEMNYKKSYNNQFLTDLIIYYTDDVSSEQWEMFKNNLEAVDLDLMRSMDVDSQVDILYCALSIASKKALKVKQKFKDNNTKENSSHRK